jgi:hypothetical protein
MNSFRRPLMIILSFTLVLSACTMPATYATSPATTVPVDGASEPDLAYTAAAQTIAAQLTEIALPFAGTPLPPGTAEAIAALLTPTETLPPTSTPLPPHTPLPSDTAVPTTPPPPTNTRLPSPSPTATLNDPGVVMGAPTWTDPFDQGLNWPIYTDEHVQMALEDGQLVMTALNADKYEAWMIIPNLVLTDFYAEAKITHQECSGLDRYGLLARSSLDARLTYLFGFTCDGRYSLRIWNGADFTMLVEWKPSDAIFTDGQTNRLGFKAEGSKLSLYANGVLLEEVEDATFTEGSIGLFIGAVNTPGFTILVDEVSYWDLTLQ